MTVSAPVTPERQLRAVLHNLRAEADGIGAGDLSEVFAALDDRLRSRRLLVAVVGEHNRGKSTLINSLNGWPWLPVGQTTPTLPPIYIVAGAHDRVELVYDDGSTAETTRSELLSLSAEDASSIAYARAALLNPDLQGMMIVDTPGLNDPDTSRLAQTVYGLLPRCDLALLVLDSTQALGASELEFIEQRLAPAGLHRLVVVLNRDDDLEDETQRRAVRERVERLLTPLLGGEPEILPYAARTALRARERKDTRLLSRSGYPELRALLANCAASRGQIMQTAVLQKAHVVGDVLSSRLEPIPAEAPPVEAALIDPAAQRVERACRALTTIGEEYSLDLSAFAIALRDRLEQETAEATPEDIRRFLPFYIQEQFTTFLKEQEPLVLARAHAAMREVGLEEVPALALTVRAPAPGLHPFVPPDFLEDSLLLSTFLTVIGLTLRPIMSTAIMTVGPILRMLTRNLREQDERGALLGAARAATMQAATVLERQTAPAFAAATEAIRAQVLPAASAPPAQLVEDTERAAARRRVEALLHTLDEVTDHHAATT